MSDPGPSGSAWARLGRATRRVVGLTTLVLVIASTVLLGVVVVGGATGRWRLLPVRTGSMTPHAPQGSVIVVHPTPVTRVRRGDVIVFQAPIPGHPLVVHRVYRLLPGPSGPVVLTKGDANPVPDPWRFRIRSQTVWRGGMVVPELGNLLFLLESGDARVATLATATALVAMIGLAAIWSSDLVTIAWRPPEAGLPHISWRADGAPSRARLRRISAVRRPHRARPRADRGGSAHRELIPVAVAVLAVGTATVIGSGVLATFTGPAAATATYASGKLVAPTSLACQWTASTNVKLTWTDASPTFTTGYSYLRGTASGGPYSSIGTTVGESSTTGNDTSPGAPTVHYYVTVATHGAWTSANSNQVVSTGCTEAISLVAGNGTAGFTGDGTAATGAELNGPVGVAADSAGNIYIADTTNNRIRKVTAGGTISTFAGGGANTACSFTGSPTSVSLSAPIAIAVDSAGTVYIADYSNNCIRKVSGGTVSQVAGGGASTACSFSGSATSVSLSTPGGIAVDSAGAVYVSDTGHNCIRKISGGTVSQVAGGGASTACSFSGAATSLSLNTPYQVAVDSGGAVYVADSANSCIRKISGGTVSQVAGGGASTACSFSGAATSLSLSTPSAVIVNSAGTLFITDSGHNCIRKISGGTVSQVAGTGTASYSGDNGYANAATLSNPGQLWLTSTGDLLVADHANNRVRKVGTP